MMNTNKKTPKLRFKGFTDGWEQRKLGSIGSTYTGLSGKTKEDFGHGEAQYITYLNVFQNTISDITMTDKVEIDTTQNEVKYGDVLFTTSSETPEEVGMSSVWLEDTPNIYLNSFCFGFRPNQKINPYFLGYSLRAPYMRDKIKILAQGISRYNISKNKVMELEISVPNNEEQKLLGTFLQSVDLIITLHQCKIEKLKLTKKALLQKLFPKNGKRIPEIRFKGFIDAWKQCKFKDIAFKRGKISEADLPYVEFEDINSGIGTLNKNILQKVGHKKGILFEAGDVLFGKLRPYLQNWLLCQFMGIAVGDFWVFQPQIVSSAFLYYLIQSETYQSVANISSGTKMPRSSWSLVSETRFSIPKYKEATMIGEFLTSIDKNITLHQRKLDRLISIKKGLLQQLFV